MSETAHSKGRWCSDDGIMLLAIAVINKAQTDYERALVGLQKNAEDTKHKGAVMELERFFTSQYGQMLTLYHGEAIMEMCREHAAAGRVVRRQNTVK